MPNFWFDHVHLVSPDPVKTGEFYERMLGAKKLGTRELGGGRTLVDLVVNETPIKVSQPPPQPPFPGVSQSRYGFAHLALRTDNLQAVVNDLKRYGVKSLQDINVSPTGVKFSFLLGPDDVQIELVQPTR